MGDDDMSDLQACSPDFNKFCQITTSAMRTAFSIIILLHGLIHLLGFVKGWGMKEVKELTLPISKPMGLLWLTAAALLLAFGISQWLHSKYAWWVGFVAVIVSQILILLFWKDAKFGTLPNLLILLVSMILYGDFHFQKLVQLETTQLLSRNEKIEHKIVRENDIERLPEPVKHWLRSAGAVGKPFINTGKVSQKATMKLKPEQGDWMSATATQYTTLDNPAFIWTVHVNMNSLLYAVGRDKYENGKGEMLIKMNALVNVVHEKGEKLDEGTLQRYLGEMVWFPSLALSPYITWEPIDDYTAKATMTYKGTTGSGTFHFNAQGAVTQFAARRYKGNEPDAQRYDWTMNITDYQTFEGIQVPSKMTSTWKLDEGDWTWLQLEVTDIKYNQHATKR